ncbi:hypothetical protein [Desulfobacter vibrioformis]|uniref:hypothetical protein n=1 Tax=Desulfobacter vibrioformis TaxID=34031 RepID=UPI0005537F92|nr:hypothetical protein [Desulfobacter vibrioformis]
MKKQIVGLLSAMVFLCAGTAIASDWNFYGSARVSTFWEDSDLKDQVDFSEGLQSNARIGAKVKVSDELTGRFEYGTSGGNANIRLLYGAWDFGAGTLTVGQDYTPMYLPVSCQVWNDDNGLHGYGDPYPGRHPQIKLKFDEFQIAAISTNTTYYTVGGGTSSANTQVVIPRIEVSYGINMGGNAGIDIAAGYTTFEYNDNEDVDSYVIMIRSTAQIAGFKLGTVVFYGQNAGNMIACNTSGTDYGKGYAAINTGTGQVDDVENFGAEIVVGYTFDEMFAIEAGFGSMQNEYDSASSGDGLFAYYLQAPITLAPGVTITPEIGLIDYYEDTQDQITYFGAKWQINF